MNNHIADAGKMPPWAYDPYDRVIIIEDVRDIAHMDKTATEEDAYLIAAAPELLEVLELMLQRYGYETCEYVQLAMKVIAKAKGEGDE